MLLQPILTDCSFPHSAKRASRKPTKIHRLLGMRLKAKQKISKATENKGTKILKDFSLCIILKALFLARARLGPRRLRCHCLAINSLGGKSPSFSINYHQEIQNAEE